MVSKARLKFMRYLGTELPSNFQFQRYSHGWLKYHDPKKDTLWLWLTVCHGKWPIEIDCLPINSMVIFYGYVK